LEIPKLLQKRNGVLTSLGVEQLFPPIKLLVPVDFQWIPPFKDISFLQKKYIEENLSAEKIAEEIGCRQSSVLKYR
jgi:hypothetical protein